MNSGPGLSLLVSRLIGESPLLLAAVAGAVLSAILLRGGARVFGVIGCLVLLFGTVASAAIQSTLFESRSAGRMPVEEFATYTNLLGFGTALMRAVAFGLVWAAALAGRSPAARR